MGEERHIRLDRNEDAIPMETAEEAARTLIAWGLEQLTSLAMRWYGGEEPLFGAISVRCLKGTDGMEASELAERIMVDGADSRWPIEFKTDFGTSRPRAIIIWRMKGMDLAWPSQAQIDAL